MRKREREIKKKGEENKLTKHLPPTHPQQQKLWLDEIQQEPSVWRFQPISNRPGAEKNPQRDKGVLMPSFNSHKTKSEKADSGAVKKTGTS